MDLDFLYKNKFHYAINSMSKNNNNLKICYSVLFPVGFHYFNLSRIGLLGAFSVACCSINILFSNINNFIKFKPYCLNQNDIDLPLANGNELV